MHRLLFSLLLLSGCGSTPQEKTAPTESPQPDKTEARTEDKTLDFDAETCTSECVAARPFGDDPREESFTYCSEQCQDQCAQECSEARDPDHNDRDLITANPACVDECMELF
jgi:hypothetical protein